MATESLVLNPDGSLTKTRASGAKTTINPKLPGSLSAAGAAAALSKGMDLSKVSPEVRKLIESYTPAMQKADERRLQEDYIANLQQAQTEGSTLDAEQRALIRAADQGKTLTTLEEIYDFDPTIVREEALLNQPGALDFFRNRADVRAAFERAAKSGGYSTDVDNWVAYAENVGLEKALADYAAANPGAGLNIGTVSTAPTPTDPTTQMPITAPGAGLNIGTVSTAPTPTAPTTLTPGLPGLLRGPMTMPALLAQPASAPRLNPSVRYIDPRTALMSEAFQLEQQAPTPTPTPNLIPAPAPTTLTPTPTPTLTTPTSARERQQQILVNNFKWTPNPDGSLTSSDGGIYTYSPKAGRFQPATTTPAKGFSGFSKPKTPASTTIQPETIAAITPFKPTVPAFNYPGLTPDAGLAAIPTPTPTTQMPSTAPDAELNIGGVVNYEEGGVAELSTSDLGSRFDVSEYINPETGRFYINEFERDVVFNPELREAERIARERMTPEEEARAIRNMQIRMGLTEDIPRGITSTGVPVPAGMFGPYEYQKGYNFAKGGLASIAQDLASKGRYGDTMVAHISPQEAGILKALGGSGTINPETGLPEFFLDKILKAVLPAAAGYFLGPAGAGLFSSGVTAGLTVGGLTALGTGSLEKGLAAGLGAYGGFGLSEGVAAAGGEKELFKSLTSSTPAPTTVGPGAGGVSAGTVDPTGTITGVAGEIPSPSELAQFQTQPTGTPYYGTYVDAPTGGAIQAKTASAVVPPLDPVEAFTDKVGMGTAGSLYAGTVALPSAIEETEKFQRQQAALLAKDEEERRKYRELFESTLGAVPTRMARAGGLMSLAGGGMTYMEAGGTTGPTGAPRDVTGTGDGMSDSVPATIEGVQEARLADGEFVIPADVVADIGNGSSDAGSKKLYDMMDRIRKARHGTTEQPPEINAEALMPA